MAVVILGSLLAAHVTAASEQDRSQVSTLAAKVQEVTGDAVELAFVDQGSTGAQAAQDAEVHYMPLAVVKLPGIRSGSENAPRAIASAEAYPAPRAPHPTCPQDLWDQTPPVVRASRETRAGPGQTVPAMRHTGPAQVPQPSRHAARPPSREPRPAPRPSPYKGRLLENQVI